MSRTGLAALAGCLAALLFAAGCAAMYAPLGGHPARLELAAAGRVSKADIDAAVFRQVGPLMDQPTLGHWLGPPTWQVTAYDQPTLGHWLGPPTWQVTAYLLGEARAIWPLKPLGGLAAPRRGLSARGAALFAAPSGRGRYRLTWACTVTHYWSEGVTTWQEPVYVYLRQREMTLELKPGQTLKLAPFANKQAW